MRHRKATLKLNRTASHRTAMLRNLVTSLFEHEQIVTTEAKAKALRPFAERLITLGKRGDLHARPTGPEAAKATRDEAYQDVDSHHRAAILLEELIVGTERDKDADDDEYGHDHPELASEVGHCAVAHVASNLLHPRVARVGFHHVAAVFRGHDQGGHSAHKAQGQHYPENFSDRSGGAWNHRVLLKKTCDFGLYHPRIVCGYNQKI